MIRMVALSRPLAAMEERLTRPALSEMVIPFLEFRLRRQALKAKPSVRPHSRVWIRRPCPVKAFVPFLPRADIRLAAATAVAKGAKLISSRVASILAMPSLPRSPACADVEMADKFVDIAIKGAAARRPIGHIPPIGGAAPLDAKQSAARPIEPSAFALVADGAIPCVVTRLALRVPIIS